MAMLNTTELPWWRRPLFATRQAPQPEFNVPVRGEYNGLCGRFGCDSYEARWFNIATGRYYCSSCARAITDAHRHQGRCAVCELHLSR